MTRRRLAEWALQLALLIGIAALMLWLAQNVAVNLKARNLASGFGFLDKTAGFQISQSLIAYSERSSYGRALLVGLLNTLIVSGIGIVLASLLGFAIGIARRAENALLAGLAAIYVETLRNIPLLLQLFFWYFAVLRPLPGPQEAIDLFGFGYLSNRGLQLCAESCPVLGRFNFEGGFVIRPEFLALVAALSTYTAAFIAEIVRAGLAAVPRGQREAAEALGLAPRQTLWLVILPQALRVIIPPLAGQYLNLLKNSSLAVAIAFPDLVSVFAGTALSQSGQAIEIVAITMAIYLGLSLLVAFVMNLYNRSIARGER
jgi:general L-amino acid transport system permease protein